MYLCSVCGNELGNTIPEHCCRCNWETIQDILLFSTFQPLSQNEIHLYQKKLERAKRRWNEYKQIVEENNSHEKKHKQQKQEEVSSESKEKTIVKEREKRSRYINKNIGARSSYKFKNITFYMRLAPALKFLLGIEGYNKSVVNNPFWIAETQVTYDLWYQVRSWAEKQGYQFENHGREGSNGFEGREPSSKKNEPVTNVNWYDCIVWCNAVSEMLDYNAVYTYQRKIIRNAMDRIAWDNLVVNNVDGFRLPNSNEWELAAKYNGNFSSDNSYEFPISSGYYWIPGNYVSGSIANHKNLQATGNAAWFIDNSIKSTKEVGLKPSTGNGLGLFDMSGNVWEWCFDNYPKKSLNRVYRGGSCNSYSKQLQVGSFYSSSPLSAFDVRGFRLARTKK